MISLPETCYAKSGDTCIAYQVMGNGPFDLVLVAESWMGLAQREQHSLASLKVGQ
jgi:hypothetical protein